MRVAIATLGTRGDAAPYVVLGQALQAAGHDVLVSTTERFRGLVEGAGLRFDGLPGDPGDASAAIPLDVSPWRPRHHVRSLRAAVGLLVDQADPQALAQRWADRDFVVFTTSTTFSHFIAAELGVRSAMVVMTPAVATGAFAHPVLAPGLRLGRHANLATWLGAERLQGQMFREPLKPSARRAHGLPAFPLATNRRTARWPPFPIIHAYSPAVVPRPDDWPDHVTVTGWLLPAPSTDPLPDTVEQFLTDGPPPIYIGFGSMPIPHPDTTAQRIANALTRTRQRAIVCGNPLAHTQALQHHPAVLTLDDIPHQHLLHRVRAVIHHGGSGTTGAGLRAGAPTLITPFIFDQFFWGHRTAALGAGPKPIPFGKLTEDRLTHAINQLTTGRYDHTAHHLAHHITTEHPTTNTIHALQQATGV